MFTDVTAKRGGNERSRRPAVQTARPPRASRAAEGEDRKCRRQLDSLAACCCPTASRPRGARVVAMRRYWSPSVKRTPLARTTAGPDGQFAIRVPSPTYDGIGTAGPAAMIAAEANGFGVQGHWWAARIDKSAEVVLKLVPELPIHGRIVDRAGKPVRDARVTLVWQQTPNQGFGAWLEGARSGSPASDRLAMGQELQAYDDESKPPIITDHDGRFTLRGVGTERVAHLAVKGETIAYTEIEVVTQAIKPFGRKAREGMVEVSGADFTCQAIPTPADRRERARCGHRRRTGRSEHRKPPDRRRTRLISVGWCRAHRNRRRREVSAHRHARA
jgi:hypothetical protein